MFDHRESHVLLKETTIKAKQLFLIWSIFIPLRVAPIRTEK